MDAIRLFGYGPASFQSPVLSGIGSMIPGSLFSGELTLGLISQTRIRSAGNGFSDAFKSPSSDSPNHLAWSSSDSITGMRVCIRATSSFGSLVMIVQVRSHSLVAGSFHPSQRPANTNGESSFIPMAQGIFPPTTFFHSDTGRVSHLARDGCDGLPGERGSPRA